MGSSFCIKLGNDDYFNSLNFFGNRKKRGDLEHKLINRDTDNRFFKKSFNIKKKRIKI
jgi:hypothetical protein